MRRCRPLGQRESQDGNGRWLVCLLRGTGCASWCVTLQLPRRAARRVLVWPGWAGRSADDAAGWDGQEAVVSEVGFGGWAGACPALVAEDQV